MSAGHSGHVGATPNTQNRIMSLTDTPLRKRGVRQRNDPKERRAVKVSVERDCQGQFCGMPRGVRLDQLTSAVRLAPNMVAVAYCVKHQADALLPITQKCSGKPENSISQIYVWGRGMPSNDSGA